MWIKWNSIETGVGKPITWRERSVEQSNADWPISYRHLSLYSKTVGSFSEDRPHPLRRCLVGQVRVCCNSHSAYEILSILAIEKCFIMLAQKAYISV